MKYYYCLMAIVGFAFNSQSCAFDIGAQPNTEATATRPATCPSQQFSDFFEVFSESVATQRAFTQYPLIQLELDANAEPEPKPVSRVLQRGAVNFPVIPAESDRVRQSLTSRIEKLSEKKYKVLLQKDDTDYQVVYFFVKKSCWRLERIENYSL